MVSDIQQKAIIKNIKIENNQIITACRIAVLRLKMTMNEESPTRGLMSQTSPIEPKLPNLKENAEIFFTVN